MSYLVLARKYRPQVFEDLVGQGHVVTTLTNALSLDRVAHAYIFCGPRGVGKTTTARVLAKALNCQKGPTQKPCNQCPQCIEITVGNSFDVIEIDGASNRGIDQVRELRDNVKFAPASSRFKIYVIDEVHMLTQEAFNALLKTLEEPPSHVKFFFATTEVHKVPTTILSRCQRFDLRKISTLEIVDALKRIAEAEKLKIDDRALFAIAKAANGGLRDALSLLDQLISFSGGAIRYEDTLQVLGWIAGESLIEFLKLLSQGDWNKLYQLIRELDLAGKDLTLFISELAGHVRDLLILKMNPKESDLVEVPEEDLDKMIQEAELFSRDQLLQMMELILETQDRIKFSVSRRSLVEALAVRLFLLIRSVSIEALVERVEGVLSVSSESPSAARHKPPGGSAGDIQKKNESSPEHSEMISQNPWEEVLTRIEQKKPLLHALIKEGVPVWEDDRLKILFPSEKIFCVESLRSPEYQPLIQEEVGKAYQAQKIEFGLLPETGVKDSKTVPKNETGEAQGAWQAIQDDPAVRKALEMFGGKITEIKR